MDYLYLLFLILMPLISFSYAFIMLSIAIAATFSCIFSQNASLILQWTMVISVDFINTPYIR